MELITLADYERAAAETMHPQAAAYCFGGAGDEVTLRDNLDGWRRLAIRPRMLVGVGERDPGITLLGKPRRHPLLIAPVAFQRLAHPDGEIATARAAAATATTFCVPTLGTTSAVEVAEAVPDAPRWFQLYVFRDRGVSRELVARAVDHDYEALVVTVDLPIYGVRVRELRAGSGSLRPGRVPSALAAGAHGAVTRDQITALIDPDLRWSDIERFADESPIPVVVKGVLTAHDARQALDSGAEAVIVSNHGARQLDTVLSGADALSAIVAEIGDQADVLVDGGIRRGTDVVKALALGARAVLVGRPIVWGLAVDGADGAQRVLEILLAELDNALALAGAPRAQDLDASFVTPAPWR